MAAGVGRELWYQSPGNGGQIHGDQHPQLWKLFNADQGSTPAVPPMVIKWPAIAT
jgi:hypothetical protein